MQPELFRQIWPVFSAEAREHLASIGSAILELEQDPARAALLDALRRTAHSLKGSAASLGLSGVERLAHAVESSLSDFDPVVGLGREAVQAVLDALEAVEEALATGDAGGAPEVRGLEPLLAALGVGGARPAGGAPAPVEAPPPSAEAPRAGAPDTPIDRLEAAVQALCTPLEPAARRELAAQAGVAVRALAAMAPAGVRALVDRLQAVAPRLGAEGSDGARAAASLAGDLVDLREQLERPEAVPAAPAAPPRPADRSIRVLASTLDSLARQLELLSMAEARHARRARELSAVEGAAREAVRELELVHQAVRHAGPAAGLPPVEPVVQRLRAVTADLRRVARDGQREAEQQALAAAVLRDDLRSLRMVPAALMLEPLRRAVREVGGRLGKEVELAVHGADVKLDRRVVDELRDPLLHLVRNAVDHGIEPPAARRAAGKAAAGRLAIRVEPRGARVGVVLEDDGGGLDLAAVRASAVRRGLLDAEAAARLPDGEAARLIFQAGLSTAREVTAVSGRGVGLDVVHDAVTRLGGSVDVASEPGRFTRFTLDLPVTLAATAAILFRSGRELGAFPADAVERVVLLAAGDLGTVAGRPSVRVGDAQVPFARLWSVLGLAPGEPPGRQQPALLLAVGSQRLALAVDEVLGQQELVVSSLGAHAGLLAHLAGAAVLDDGRVVGVLNAAEVLRRAQPPGARAQVAAAATVVVADDSLTTRSAIKAALELAGFGVLPAADGEEAFRLVAERGARLVISDVQMPRLDGLALTRRIKADARLRQVPVILVTSLDSAEHRRAGLEAGADGYLVKREVEPGRLLELVRQLLPGRP